MDQGRARFQWRAMTSVLIAASFLLLVATGVVLFVSPPGRIANWTDWNIVSLTKRDWTGLHIWFSALFLIVAVFHLVFNWRPMLGYFKDRMTRRVGFRWEWLGALAICGMVAAGTLTHVPPFSTLLAFNERVKESWDEPRQRAPIPHAELLTLDELVAKAGLDLATASPRLEAKGIRQFNGETIVQDLAARSGMSAQRLYEIITGAPAVTGPGRGGAGHGAGGGGRGPGGGGGGGGPGRKTLSEFCADEGIKVDDAMRRLSAKGIKAEPGLTLREIAVNHGYNRPYELIEAIRGN